MERFLQFHFLKILPFIFLSIYAMFSQFSLLLKFIVNMVSHTVWYLIFTENQGISHNLLRDKFSVEDILFQVKRLREVS